MTWMKSIGGFIVSMVLMSLMSVTINGVVNIGDDNEEVRILQEQLNQVGYALEVNGIFEEHTDLALKEYQTIKKLEVDGFAGPKTMASLDQAIQQGWKRSVVLQYNISQSTIYVKYLQKSMKILGYNLDADGYFGPGTEKAVKEFQQKNGLAVDGSVGPNTWKIINISLNNLYAQTDNSQLEDKPGQNQSEDISEPDSADNDSNTNEKEVNAKVDTDSVLEPAYPIPSSKPIKISVDWKEGKSSNWSVSHIEKLKKMEYLNKTLFYGYKENINRLEFVTMLVNLYEYILSSSVSYSHVEGYADINNVNVLKATNIGITKGKGVDSQGKKLFKPYDTLTREEMATMLMRTMDALGKQIDNNSTKNFIDDGNISPWAKVFIYSARYYAYLDGIGGNLFAPKNKVTKEEALTMISKVLQKECSKNKNYQVDFSSDGGKLFVVNLESVTTRYDYSKFGEPLRILPQYTRISVFKTVEDSLGYRWGLTANGTWVPMEGLVEDTSEFLTHIGSGNYYTINDKTPIRTIPAIEVDPFRYLSLNDSVKLDYIFYNDRGNRWGAFGDSVVYMGNLSEGAMFDYPDKYSNFSEVKKIQFLLREIGFDIEVDGSYGVMTASALIVYQAYMNEVFVNYPNKGIIDFTLDIDGKLDADSIKSLETMLSRQLTYKNIKESYIDQWQHKEPTIERTYDINGRLPADTKQALVELPVYSGGVGYAEKQTAIAWAMLVHKGEYLKLGAKASNFYLTYKVSGYRLYKEQVELYNKYGSKKAAVPGRSNHGWGLALDIATTNYIRNLVSSDTKTLVEFEQLMKTYGFSPLKYDDGTYWEEWHWDYRLNRK